MSARVDRTKKTYPALGYSVSVDFIEPNSNRPFPH